MAFLAAAVGVYVYPTLVDAWNALSERGKAALFAMLILLIWGLLFAAFDEEE